MIDITKKVDGTAAGLGFDPFSAAEIFFADRITEWQKPGVHVKGKMNGHTAALDLCSRLRHKKCRQGLQADLRLTALKKILLYFTPDLGFTQIRDSPHGCRVLFAERFKNVCGEFSLAFLAYNFKRVINILGVKMLIECMTYEMIMELVWNRTMTTTLAKLSTITSATCGKN